jgi:hypothetical protein
LTKTEEVAVYRLLQVPGLGETALGRVLAAWREEPELIDRFWGRPASEYRNRWGLSKRAALHLHEEAEEETGRGGEAAVAAARARAAEIELLTVMDPQYAALAAQRGLPPLLFTRGNQDLLWEAGVAIPHSSDAPEEALAWGTALARALAETGTGLVSSQNRDGYRRVAAEAKRAGAPLVIVLDRPLHGLPPDGPCAEPVPTARLWDERFHSERELILSPLAPDAVWTPRSARGRDGLVIGLAAAVVAGGVRPGGTIAGACARAGAESRLLFRSPYCRAEVGVPLPHGVDRAAEVVIQALQAREKAPAPRPGWIERRWSAEVAAFVEALEAVAGSGARVVRRPVTALIPNGAEQREWLQTGVMAVIHLPPPPSSGPEEGIVVVRSGSDPAAPSEAPALLLAPPEPILDLETLRGYLARCRAHVAPAIRTLLPSEAPAPGPPPIPAAGPSPGSGSCPPGP